MNNISFFYTQQQIIERTKEVTRRDGWKDLKAGTILQGCKKCQGLKPGEALERLVKIKVLNVRTEQLSRMANEAAYGKREATLEGFPEMSGLDFVRMFREHMGGKDRPIQRIHFSYECRILTPGGDFMATAWLTASEIFLVRHLVKERQQAALPLRLAISKNHWEGLQINPDAKVIIGV